MEKVLVFTPNLPPEADAAGVRIEPFVIGLKKKFDVQVISGNQGTYTSLRTWIPAPNNRHGFVLRLFFDIACGFELFFRILFSSRKVVFLSCPPYFSTLIGAWGALLRNKFLVLDIRDIYPEVFVDHNLVSQENFIYKILLKLTHWTYKKANMVIAVTEGVKSRFEECGLSNVQIYRNGFDETKFSPNGEKYPEFTVVFHGNLGSFQNIDLLLEVAQEVGQRDPDIRFLVVGAGAQGSKIAESDLKNLEYLGHKNYADIPAIIGPAHLGLSFRTDGFIGRTAFPVKIYEYLGSGIPVINTPMTESGDFLEQEGVGKQFANNELEQIVSFILELKSKNLQVDAQQYQKFARGKIVSRFVENLENDLKSESD